MRPLHYVILEPGALPLNRVAKVDTLKLKELAMVGVELPAISDVLDRTAKAWLKPILAARKELILVLPPKGEEVHPIWLMIEAFIEKIPVAGLESLLALDSHDIPPVAHVPLPARRRWWALPEGLVVKPLPQDSFSPRLLKKVQLQGGARRAGHPPQVGQGVLQVRRNERPSKPTPQMGLFQQPARVMRPSAITGTTSVTSSCAQMSRSDPRPISTMCRPQPVPRSRPGKSPA